MQYFDKKRNVNTSKIFVKLILLQNEIYRSYDPYSKLTEIFPNLLEKQAPIKNKVVRGSQASFMKKEESTIIMEKFRIQNRY